MLSSFPDAHSLIKIQLLSGPVPPPPHEHSDDEGDRAWGSNDQRDFEDQQYSPPSPMAHYPGSRNPLVRFLSDVPDWSILDSAALNNALQGLPVPIAGPVPPGISLQDAIKVRTLEDKV